MLNTGSVGGERKGEGILTSLLSWVENERTLLMIHGTDLEKGMRDPNVLGRIVGKLS